MAERAKLIVEADTKDLKWAKKDLDALVPAAKAVETSTDKVANSFNNTGKASKDTGLSFTKMANSFKVQKGALQNAAFQMQDIAVQFQGGTRASLTLSQQLPQLLGAFGAGGAVLGLFASLSAAAFAPLIDGLFDSENAVETLSNTLEELDKSAKIANDGVVDLTATLHELQKVSTLAFQATLKEQILSTEEALMETRESIVDLIVDSGELTTGFISTVKAFKNGEISARYLSDSYNRLFLSSKNNSDEFRAMRSELEQLTQGSEEAEKKLARMREALSAGSAGTTVKDRDEQKDKVKKAIDENDRLIDAETKAYNKRIESAEAYIFKLEDSFRTQDEVLEDRYNQRIAKIRGALNMEIIAEEEAQALMIANQQQYNQASMQLDVARATQMSSFFGQSAAILEQGFGKQNAITKLAFAAQKIAAIPQMLVATEQGATMALGLGPYVGPIVAGTIKALGYASIGSVVGQTIAGGRALGGQVRPGESYRVGEYGPETITMGSSGGFVTPKASANDSQVNLVTNVKVIGGNGNAEVTNTVSKKGDNKWVQDIIVTEMGNPTSKSRQALQGSSNVTATGTR